MENLSSRCLQNISSEEIRNFMGTVFGNPWSECNPDGIFPMGIAENRLMYVWSYTKNVFSILAVWLIDVKI